jgi:hypothetical protein
MFSHKGLQIQIGYSAPPASGGAGERSSVANGMQTTVSVLTNTIVTLGHTREELPRR